MNLPALPHRRATSRRRSIFHLLILATMLACPASIAVSQDEASGEPAAAKHPRALDVTDVAAWQQVNGFEVAPTGDWCGYVIQPNEGDVEVTLKQLEGDKSHSFKGGPGSGAIAFSHDGRWAAFRSAPLDRDAKAAAKRKEPLKNKTLLINLDSGEKVEFEAVQQFSFSGESARWLAVHRSRPKEQPTGDKGWDGSDLVLHRLSDGSQLNFGNVNGFGFNKAGDWLAMTIDADDHAGNALQLLDTESARLVILDSDRADYSNLAWAKEGDARNGFKSICG